MKGSSRVGRQVIIAILLTLVVALLPGGSGITTASPSSGTALASGTQAGATPAISATTPDSPTSQTVSSCDQPSLTNAIAAAGSGGTVQFTTDCVAPPLTLTSPITLSQSLTIDGNGHDVTISGNNSVQVFYVSSGVSVTLKNLTIANGYYAGPGSSGEFDGGGIYNAGTLDVTGSTFSGNSGFTGGGIHNVGTLAVANSTFSGNSANGGGGGIFNTGILTVTTSIFIDNRLSSGRAMGGGIDNVGTLAVANSTFSGNSAAGSSGGGIENGAALVVTGSTFDGNSAASGGGIGNDTDSTLTVANSTFSGNSVYAYGGGIDNGGTLAVTSSTFSGNTAAGSGTGVGGGGISTSGTLALTNTILAGAGTGGECRLGSTNGASGVITDNGGNLADDASCDLTSMGSNSNVTTLNLGPLQDNGGPLAGAPSSAAVVPTIALQAASAAIGYGVLAACQTAQPGGAGGLDQRGPGFPRPDPGDTACDSGAYEVQAGPPLTNTATSTPTATASSTPTASPTSTATNTPTDTPTVSPTNTPVPATGTSTGTPTSTATDTPAPPASTTTDTPIPPTNTPTATATPATPPAGSCALFSAPLLKSVGRTGIQAIGYHATRPNTTITAAFTTGSPAYPARAMLLVLTGSGLQISNAMGTFVNDQYQYTFDDGPLGLAVLAFQVPGNAHVGAATAISTCGGPDGAMSWRVRGSNRPQSHR